MQARINFGLVDEETAAAEGKRKGSKKRRGFPTDFDWWRVWSSPAVRKGISQTRYSFYFEGGKLLQQLKIFLL